MSMAYLPRYEIICDNAHFHVTWQCHNKDWLMQWEWAKKAYYHLLLKYKDKYGIQIYSYNFMDNHPHLTGRLECKEQFSAFFRTINSQFARRVNRQLSRRGQVVMDRFKSPMIESDEHMLTVMAYVDLNQHRVGKVSHPRKNDWSSYQYYAYGKEDPLLTPSPSYLALGNSPLERQHRYRAMVESLIKHRRTMNISRTSFIGNPDWVIAKYRQLCERLGRRVSEAALIRMAGPPG